MNNQSFYRRMLKSLRRLRFEISSFALTVLGVWLVWKLSRKPFIADWVVYLIVLWIVVLVLHMARITYLLRRSKKRE